MKVTVFTLLASMLATAAMAEDKMTINLCTGGEGKPYFQTGDMIQSFMSNNKNATVRVIATDGTWDNIQRTVMTPMTPETLASGESCHAFVGQPDGAVLLKRKNPAAAAKLRVVGQGPLEFLHVLCGKESGVDDLSDIAGDNTKSVALGKDGSGAWLIWQNFVAEDKSYGEVVVSNESGALAMSSVAENTTTCMLVPAALGNATVNQADEEFGDSMLLAGANDKDFNDATTVDGKPLYRWQAIPSGTYQKNLQGWFSSADTIAWQAGIYVNKEAFVGHDRALEDFISAAAKIKPALKHQYGSLE
jgi:TRAP-type uncharacterized transport system substrate-binding protein